MSFQAILGRATIAAAFIAAAPLAAHAATFNAASTATFTLSDTIVGLQSGDVPIEVTVPANGGVITNAKDQVTAVLLPLSGVQVTGSNLTSFAGVGSGLTLSSGGASVSLTDFAYSTSSKELTFSLTVSGVAGTLSGAFIAGSQSTTTPFVDGAAPAGSFLASSLKLNSATASAIASGLGLSSLYAVLLPTIDFGSVRVNVNAVPEPSTYALIGLGLAGAAFVARRRKQA